MKIAISREHLEPLASFEMDLQNTLADMKSQIIEAVDFQELRDDADAMF